MYGSEIRCIRFLVLQIGLYATEPDGYALLPIRQVNGFRTTQRVHSPLWERASPSIRTSTSAWCVMRIVIPDHPDRRLRQGSLRPLRRSFGVLLRSGARHQP